MELESFKKAQGRVALYRLGDTWTFELTAKNEFLYYQKCFYLKCLSLSCFILEKMLMFRSQKIYTESGNVDRIDKYMVDVWNEIGMFA